METIKITTEGGYTLEGTPNHPIIARDTIYKKFGTWTELQDITKNHFALIQLNQQVFGNKDELNYSFKKNGRHKDLKLPKTANKDFAYLIGLLLGDGFVGERSITITTKDKEIKDFIRNNPFGLNFSESKDGIHFKAGSDEFIAVLKSLGYKKVKAKFKTIPEKCLEWSKENICSLLSGLFDTDGCCDIRKNGKSRITLASASIELIKQVQMLLLNLGIISSFEKQEVKPTKKVKASSTLYKIIICDQRAVKRFKEQIGFRIKRKADKVKYELKKYQRQYIKKNNCEFLWKRITKIEKSKNRTFDFNIPVSHNFFSNGFISHNTPFGKNWFYHKYIKAKEKNCGFHFTSRDNPYFPENEWERAKEELPEDVFNQEYRAMFLESAASVEELPEDVFNQEYRAMFLESAASVFKGIREVIKEDCLADAQKDHYYVMGVDLAKYQDFTVICVIDTFNNHVVYFDRFQKIDYSLQKSRIKAVAQRYNNARIIVDSSNIGVPIKEDLEREGLIVDDFKFSNISKKNLIDKLSIFIQQKQVFIPPIRELVDELESFGYELSDKGNVIYSAPKGFHDDCVISLALGVWGLAGKPQYKTPIEREIAKSRFNKKPINFI